MSHFPNRGRRANTDVFKHTGGNKLNSSCSQCSIVSISLEVAARIRRYAFQTRWPQNPTTPPRSSTPSRSSTSSTSSTSPDAFSGSGIENANAGTLPGPGNLDVADIAVFASRYSVRRKVIDRYVGREGCRHRGWPPGNRIDGEKRKVEAPSRLK